MAIKIKATYYENEKIEQEASLLSLLFFVWRVINIYIHIVVVLNKFDIGVCVCLCVYMCMCVCVCGESNNVKRIIFESLLCTMNHNF